MGETRVVLRGRLEELERLLRAVGLFAEEHGLSRKATLELELILEELVTNVIRHGGPPGDSAGHAIAVVLSRDGGRIRIEVEDDGRSFDPRQAAAPDLEASLEDRPVGGLGLHLVRRLVDDLHYERREGRNRLVLWKSAIAQEQGGDP